jgi:hypothetical protein
MVFDQRFRPVACAMRGQEGGEGRLPNPAESET